MHCPDSAWADDVCNACSKVIKLLLKHQVLTSIANLLDTTASADYPTAEQPNASEMTSLSSLYKTKDAMIYLVSNSIPIRINLFHKVTTTIDNTTTTTTAGLNNNHYYCGSDSILLKRLHMMKYEFRAPM